jgi:hypothetical protein
VLLVGRMDQPTFSDFKKLIDDKTAYTAIRSVAEDKKQYLDRAVVKKRIEKDAEVGRILDFCNFIFNILKKPEPVALPPCLSMEDREFYKRTVEKLVKQGCPSYLLDVFEKPVTP